MRALFALFSRALRDDIRSKPLLWARIGIAVAILYIVFSAEGAAPGLRFFSLLVVTNFLVICLAALTYFASAITEEKEEGTLGLLRLTNLSPLVILLGKSTSRLVGGLGLLLVQVPFAILAITLGGIRLDQVISCYALLAAFLFFVCNVGLLASVLSRHTGGAAILTAAFSSAFLCWPVVPVLWSRFAPTLFSSWTAMPLVPKALVHTYFTPEVLGQVLASRAARVDITPNLTALLIGGAIAFILARLLFEWCCSEDSRIRRERHTPLVRDGRRSESPCGRPWEDAICWRDFYFLHGGARALLIKSGIYFALSMWVASAAFDHARANAHHIAWWQKFAIMVFGTAVATTCFESLFANSRIYRVERKEKTLSGLYILPQRFDRFLLSKRRAAFLALTPGLAFVAVAFLSVFAPIIAYVPEWLGWFILGFGFLIAQILLNHYLVAWCSLRFRWGGFPLALGMSFVGNFVTITMAWPLFPWSLLPLLAGAIFVCIYLRTAFHRQLVVVAGEE